MRIFVQNILDYLKQTDEKYHFVFSDLPYEMSIIGNAWDNTGISYSIELYKLLLAVMLPGAFAAFYSSSETEYVMRMAMAKAGFKMHKATYGWVYPDGNPQGAQNTPKAADKQFAAIYGGFCKCDNQTLGWTANVGFVKPEFKDIAKEVDFCSTCNKPIQYELERILHSKTGGMVKLGGAGYGNGNIEVKTKPVTIEAELLQNHTYGMGWGKPYLEPLIIAQAPFGKKAEIKNVLQYGTGIVNKSGKHPGNFFYVHARDCTQDKCSDECLSNQLRFDYVNVFPEVDESQVFEHSRVRNERHEGLDYRNEHPSVKPIAVNKMIAQMFLPPVEYGPRKVLNPFSGSGSESIGLRQAGWDKIDAVEINSNFAKTHFDRYCHYFPDDEPVMHHAA